MDKQEFLLALRKALYGLPQDEVEERVAFYSEMIDDRMEEGCSEEEAVAGVDAIDRIVKRTVADVPMKKIVQERIKTKRSLEGWEKVVLVLGFPLWFPLLITVGALVLALYAVIFSLVIAIWGVEIGLLGSAVGGVGCAALYAFQGQGFSALAALGIGIFAAGATILMFPVCVAATKGLFRLCGGIAVSIKRLFIRKENTK